jgi:hypothetical protein
MRAMQQFRGLPIGDILDAIYTNAKTESLFEQGEHDEQERWFKRNRL